MKQIQCFVAALLLTGGIAWEASGQLAITEVMAEPLTPLNFFRGPDFWELTNFGDNTIDLTGYSFEDKDGKWSGTDVFANLQIAEGKSIIFFQRKLEQQYVTTPSQFRAWWGANVPEDLQIREYTRPGFNGGRNGDQIRLLDPAGNVVDIFKFDESQHGHSFVYNRTNGVCCDPSLEGVNGAFKAEQSDDVASPGITTGRVPLFFVQQPADQTNDAGTDAIFHVVPGGLPRPHFQWRTNGTEIPGATASSLILSNVGPDNGGRYQVTLDNGSGELLSRAAILVVNTNIECARIIHPPSSVTVFSNQTAIFSTATRGYPLPRYQWQSNGIVLVGATDRSLSVANASMEMSGTTYSVQVCNEVSGQECCTSAAAMMIVTRRPDLKFTEVMATPSTGSSNSHKDWFEISNCDDFVVDLNGYLISDSTNAFRLGSAFAVTGSLVVQPGKSVLFVEEMSVEAFSSWWGPDQLPPDVQIRTYYGFGLAPGGEELYLWNPAASDESDRVATATWDTNKTAISIGFDYNCCFEDYGCIAGNVVDSVAGRDGAFRAVEGGDIGSPGYTTNSPPRLLGLSRDASGVSLRCRVVEGKAYSLYFKSALSDPTWTWIETRTANDSIITMQDTSAGEAPTRFYRLEEAEAP